MDSCLEKKKHISYFKRCLQILPSRFSSLDTTRMTVAFFGISGLEILDAVDNLKDDKKNIIDWIYGLQILPNDKEENLDVCGFRGSTTIGSSRQISSEAVKYDSGHIAMTYTALLSLLILEDDLSGVSKKGVVAGLRKLQLPDGSFCPTPEGSENDMRFIYCACCISYILNDWSGMDIDLTLTFIKNSLSYEGAFGQGPGLEAHGGSTFCAIASLVLMNKLHAVLSSKQIERLKQWCILRQQSGFQGRPNKPVDTCYSFWVGASLQLLGVYQFINYEANRAFLMETQDCVTGGFSKWPDTGPDGLHAYFGVCGMSLMGEPGLTTIHAALNVSERTHTRLLQIHQKWGVQTETECNHRETSSNLSLPLTDHQRSDPPHNKAAYCDSHTSGQIVDNEKSTNDIQPVNCDTMNSSCKSKSTESSILQDHKDHPCPSRPEWNPVPQLKSEQHVAFLKSCLKGLNTGEHQTDDSRLVNVFYALAGLEFYDVTTVLSEEERTSLITWIYSSHLLLSQSSNEVFKGSTSQSVKSRAAAENVFKTYCAISALLILRDDLCGLQVNAVINSLRTLEQSAGSSLGCVGSKTGDLSGVYSAVCVSYYLQDFTALNVEAMVTYIKQCYKSDGGFSPKPDLESRPQYVYHAISSLALLDNLQTTFTSRQLAQVYNWCTQRQKSDLEKHAGKHVNPADLFWTTSTLKILNSVADNDVLLCLLTLQHEGLGGFVEESGKLPDASHTYYSLAGLSLQSTDGLSALDPRLGLTQRTVLHLDKVWETSGGGTAL